MRVIRAIVFGLFLLIFAVWGVSSFIVIKNKDDMPPVIEAQSDHISVSASSGDAELKQGLTASDNKDGDLTDQILIGKQSKFINKGTTEVTYIVFDSSNNAGYCTRTVDYIDYVSPQFHLSEPLVFEEGEKITILDRMTVMDSVQGDISDKIKIISSDVDEEEVGVYTMGIEVSNKFGDLVTAALPINIVAKNSNQAELTFDEYFRTLNMFEGFDPALVLPKIQLPDGSQGSEENITIESNVDSSIPGTYQVLYKYDDGDGITGSTSLTVLVRE